jgi:hypothetical protein
MLEITMGGETYSWSSPVTGSTCVVFFTTTLPAHSLSRSSSTPAATRTANDLQVGVARDGLARIIALHPEAGKDIDAINRWVAKLSPDGVLQKFASMQLSDRRQLDTVVRAMIADAQKTTGQQ